MECTRFTFESEGLFIGVVDGIGAGTLCFCRKSMPASSPSERDMPPPPPPPMAAAAAAVAAAALSLRGGTEDNNKCECAASNCARAGLDMTLGINCCWYLLPLPFQTIFSPSSSSSLILRRPFRGGGAVRLLLRRLVSVDRKMPSLARCSCSRTTSLVGTCCCC